MLPYSLHYFKELIETGEFQKSALATFGMRNGLIFSPKALGTARISHVNTGFDLLQGNAQFEEKFSVVALSPSMISLTILDTQTARTSAKSTDSS